MKEEMMEVNGQNILNLIKSLLPGNKEEMLKLCQEGFHRAVEFLQTHNLILCEDCIKLTTYLADRNIFTVDDLKRSLHQTTFCPSCTEMRSVS